MVNGLDLKKLIHTWFDYEEEDDVNRPCWIRKHCGEINEKCKYNTSHNLYTMGEWNVK